MLKLSLYELDTSMYQCMLSMQKSERLRERGERPAVLRKAIYYSSPIYIVLYKLQCKVLHDGHTFNVPCCIVASQTFLSYTYLQGHIALRCSSGTPCRADTAEMNAVQTEAK